MRCTQSRPKTKAYQVKLNISKSCVRVWYLVHRYHQQGCSKADTWPDMRFDNRYTKYLQRDWSYIPTSLSL